MREWPGEQEQRLARLTSELESQTNAAMRAEQALVDNRAKLASCEAAAAAEQHKAARLEKELETTRQRLGEQEQKISRLTYELQRRADEAEAAEESFRALQKRLAQTESVLAQRGQEAEQAAAELAAAREEMRHIAAARHDLEKISAGLKEHVVLLMADLKLRQAAFESLQQAHQAELASHGTKRRSGSALGRIVANLLDAPGGRWLRQRMRLRRQLKFVKRSGLVDGEWYLRMYPDVAEAGLDPLHHYVEFGAKEGRAPSAAVAQASGQTRLQASHATRRDPVVPHADAVMMNRTEPRQAADPGATDETSTKD